jgi:hypothetical protein
MDCVELFSNWWTRRYSQAVIVQIFACVQSRAEAEEL